MLDKHHVLIVSAVPRTATLWDHALERAGYHVSCVARASAALQLLQAERVDAVVIDAPLLDMASDALALLIRERWSRCCVLLRSSGELAARYSLADDPGLGLLQQAVTAQRLKKTLQRMLQPVVQVRVPARRYAGGSLDAH